MTREQKIQDAASAAESIDRMMRCANKAATIRPPSSKDIEASLNSATRAAQELLDAEAAHQVAKSQAPPVVNHKPDSVRELRPLAELIQLLPTRHRNERSVPASVLKAMYPSDPKVAPSAFAVKQLIGSGTVGSTRWGTVRNALTTIRDAGLAKEPTAKIVEEKRWRINGPAAFRESTIGGEGSPPSPHS